MPSGVVFVIIIILEKETKNFPMMPLDESLLSLFFIQRNHIVYGGDDKRCI